jgi:UDP-GlcNAc:undecaprenyl-phosphate/decaprenyl-phosphate GlcNAc-1-phosphate transferase
VREYLLILMVAAAVTYLVTPYARAFAIRFGALAEVRDRDVHSTPTPRLGGLAMAAGLVAALLLASQLRLVGGVFERENQHWALLSGVAVILVIGIIDDRWGLDAATKIVGQILAAGLMAVQGIQLLWLPVGGTLVLDPFTSVGLTILVVVVTINAVNFVDGLDGLAAGVVGIGALAFLAYAYVLSVEYGFSRATLPALLAAALAGMCMGFLPHNVHRARLFMGDTGSMLIGLVMAAAAVTLTGYVDPAALQRSELVPTLLPLILPVAVVFLPLLDLVLAVVRRTRAGRDPFSPDKQHIHHRIMDLGHSQRRAVVIMWGWTAVLAFTTVAFAFLPAQIAVASGAAGLLVLALVLLRGSSDESPAAGVESLAP